MDATSVQLAFTLKTVSGTAVTGTWSWSGGRTGVFAPKKLSNNTSYTATVGGTATNFAGTPLDGNGDGVGGDACSFGFRVGR